MSFQVLQSMDQVSRAREQLLANGLSFSNSWLRSLLWSISRGRIPRVGDQIKSWDVLRTVEFAQANVARDAKVLDLGAFGSEIPLVLRAAGYSKVFGVDLNPNVVHMPHADDIRYVRGNFHQCPFESATFDLITAISVIEHGYEPERLLAEVARLLRSGGYFVASFDYWPEKIATADTRIFGLDWLIFSAADVRSLIATAGQLGLAPVGGLEFAAREHPVRFERFEYTFGWLALRKN